MVVGEFGDLCDEQLAFLLGVQSERIDGGQLNGGWFDVLQTLEYRICEVFLGNLVFNWLLNLNNLDVRTKLSVL